MVLMIFPFLYLCFSSFISSSNGKRIVAKGVFFLLFSEGSTKVGHLLLEAFDECILGSQLSTKGTDGFFLGSEFAL